DKVTFGGNVGTATLANTTELAQIKAVKAVDDKVTGNTQTITNLGDQITNVGKTSKEEVAIVENSGLTLDTTAATTTKGAIYTLGLDAAKVKEVAGTTTLAADLAAKANKDASNLTDGDKADWKRALDLGNVLTSANLADRLLITGSNVGSDDNKVKLGKNVGKDEITGETTQLVQEKAVKSYVDTALEKVGKGKDGEDGHIGVDGKDGMSGVGIDGKDGITVKGDKGEVGINGNDGLSIKGEDGKDGSIGLSGKDGITVKGKDGKDGVTIKGEDGANGTNGVIGLNGHDGIDGKDKKAVSADIKVVNGRPGVDGKDGDSLTRIIYEDEAGDTHTVATMDDGLAFQGDSGDKVTRKLNDTLNIKGGVTEANKLTDNNIGVVNDSANGLAVKLAKELTALDS
ncbi:hypothetical protein QJU96_10625, partial [Pasteurella skyensis]|nr:hypothetical protein [Pasteurella skyensis]